MSAEAYWDRQPCNINHSKHPPGSIEAFVETAGRRYFVEPHILSFADFPRWSGKRVLDFGCGIGTDALNFARWGATTYGVDTSQASLDIARTRGTSLGWHVMWRNDLTQPEEIDLVWAYGSIHHTENPQTTLEQLYACLARGGEIRAMVYNKYSWKNLQALGGNAVHLLPFLAKQGAEAQPDCPIVHFYTKDTARRLFESAGFRNITLDVTHIFKWSVPEYTHGYYVKDGRFEGCDLPELAAELGQHILIRGIK